MNHVVAIPSRVALSNHFAVSDVLLHEGYYSRILYNLVANQII